MACDQEYAALQQAIMNTGMAASNLAIMYDALNTAQMNADNALALFNAAVSTQAVAQKAYDDCINGGGGGGGAAQGRKPARLETDSDRITMLEETVRRLADKLRLLGEGKPAA